MKYLKKGLFIAVVSTLIFLTGCDDILESFYPEFAGDGQFGGNSISVRVQVPDTIGEGSAVVARIEWADPFFAPPEGFSSYEVVKFAEYDPNRDEFNAFAEFFGLPEGTYRVFVFVDANDNYNEQPFAEFTDPSGFAGYVPEPGEPGFNPDAQEQEPITELTVGNVRRLDAFIEFDDVQETTANRNVVLGTTGGLDSGFTVSAAETVTYRLGAEDSDVNLQDVVWQVRNASGESLANGSEFNPSPAPTIDFSVNYGSFPESGQLFLYADSILNGGGVDGQLSNPVLLPIWKDAATDYDVVSGAVTIVIQDATQIEGVQLNETYTARVVFFGQRLSEGGSVDLERETDLTAVTLPGELSPVNSVAATVQANGFLTIAGAADAFSGVSSNTSGNEWVQVIIDVNGNGIGYGDAYINAPIVDQITGDGDGYGVQLRGAGFKPLIPLN